MTARTSGPRELRRAPELRLPYPLLEYLLRLPGDYAKLLLRLLQRAQWTPVVTQTGVALDAGEVLLSLRSRDGARRGRAGGVAGGCERGPSIRGRGMPPRVSKSRGNGESPRSS